MSGLERNREKGVVLMEVKQLGNIMPTGARENPNQGRAYDSTGLSPSISCMQGGNLQPMVINEQLSGTYEMPGKNYNQRNTVHGENAVCRTIIGGGHAGNEPKVLVKNLPAVLTPKRTEYGKQIRKSYESGEIRESRHNMTQLEPRTDGITNTLTTVQKDNLVLIKQATEKGYIECDIGGVADLSFPDSKTRRGRVQERGQVSPTLTASGSTEIHKIESAYRIRKLTPRECGRLMDVSDDDITKMIISRQEEIENFFKYCEEKGIRYKGKREFDEAERIQKMSNSQLYKQFGNSIVKSCMVAMFSNLNIQGLPRWEEIKERYTQGGQNDDAIL